MVDLVRVEPAVRVHVVRVLVERRMVQIGSGHRQRFGRVRQVGEHHRRGQHVHRVILPTETRVEQAGDDVRALEIEIIPHALAQQRIRVLPAFEIRGVAEEPCQNRADHRAQPQFGDRVLFRNVVDADLCRSGATHHARTELSDTSQVGGHRLVSVLRIDGNVGVTGFRLVTIVDESETKFFEDGVDFAAERAVQCGELLRLVQDADGRFQLSARFQRYGDAVTGESDQSPVFPVFLVFVVIRADAVEQRFNAVAFVVGHRGIVAVMYRQVFDFHAKTAGAALLAAGFEEFDKAFHMLRIRLGQQVRVRDLWRCHSGHPNEKRHSQHRLRYTENR